MSRPDERRRDPGSPKVEPPLRFIVESEAQRLLSEAQIEADPERLAQGWERRFIADGARAEEMMRLYEDLGFEVAADPIRPENVRNECEDCRLLIQLEFKMIYTRRKPAAPRGG